MTTTPATTPTTDDPGRYRHGHAMLTGRYWPVAVDPTRRPDGTIDITALCALYDHHMNAAIQ